MLRVGITGGIGSGKTSVCRVFEILGVPIFYADIVAKNITNDDYSVREQLNAVAGCDLFAGGVFDRSLLAKIIYADTDKLKQVNAIVHPIVFNRFIKWAEQQSNSYVIAESAILFESGFDKYVDKVITITAPTTERINRVMKRDDFSREKVESIIANQFEDNIKVEKSDFVIANGEKDMVIPKILEIDKKLILLENGTERFYCSNK